ncbi:MAG: protein rep [Nitrospira sp.]|nr:protein rep [Nitrospira sp.]
MPDAPEKTESVFSRYATDKAQVARKLAAAGNLPGVFTLKGGHNLLRRADRVEACGRYAVGVTLFESGDGKTHHRRCRDRLCPVCMAIGATAVAVSLKQLIRDEFKDGARLFMMSFTVKHTLSDTLESTRRVLDRAWFLLGRLKEWKGIALERHRVAEVEYTKKNGAHPHFHVLVKLNPDHESWHWRRDYLQKRILEMWAGCTAKAGRRSTQIDVSEMRRVDDDRLRIRYYDKKACAWRSRVEPLEKAVSELVKYATKRHADGKKGNQIPFEDYTPEMVAEYATGIAGWNLHRSSKGWAAIQRAFKDAQDEELQLAAAELGEGEFWAWPEIVDFVQSGIRGNLDDGEERCWRREAPRILATLAQSDADRAHALIEPWILYYFGDRTIPRADLPVLKLTNWERAYAARRRRLRFHARDLKGQTRLEFEPCHVLQTPSGWQ